MSVGSLVALLVFLFPLAYSPGPGNAFFAAIGASHGLRATVPALAGYHLATLVVTTFVGFGIGVTVFEHPGFAKALGAAGSMYILWLAFGFLRAARTTAGPRVESGSKRQNIGFWSGAIVLLMNPKAYYIIAVMFTQFLRPSTGETMVSVPVIALVFTLNNLVAFLVWASGGRALTAIFHSESARRRIDHTFAATLVGVAIWMAFPLFT